MIRQVRACVVHHLPRASQMPAAAGQGEPKNNVMWHLFCLWVFKATAEGYIFILIMSILLVFITKMIYQIIVNIVRFCFNVFIGNIEDIPRAMPELLHAVGEGVS